jgi:hypothetical protein
MSASLAIGWAFALIVSVWVVFQTVGLARMVAFFPEGRRWWMFPAQIASLALFAIIVLKHPF